MGLVTENKEVCLLTAEMVSKEIRLPTYLSLRPWHLRAQRAGVKGPDRTGSGLL